MAAISMVCEAHKNETRCKIFNVYVENQSCKPYYCATQAAA